MAVVKQSTDPLYIDATLAKLLFQDGKSTFFTKVREIREEIRNGRYADYAILEEGKIKVCKAVYTDYSTYRARLKEKNLRKHVPPFDAKKIAPYITVEKEVIFYVEEP